MRVPHLPILLTLLLSKQAFGAELNDGDESMFVLKHSWLKPPSGWRLHSNAPPDHTLKLYIGLKQRGFDDMIQHLLEASDPDHERYGDHLSMDALNELVAPSQDTVEAVNNWLTSNGIDPSNCQRSEAGDWLYVHLPLRKVESMLQAKYHTFAYEETGETIIRSLSWSLPTSLQAHIEVIAPTTSFSLSRPMQIFSRDQVPIQIPDFIQPESRLSPGICNETAITPDCLRHLYGTSDYVPSASHRNGLGITGYLDQYPSHSDLKTFMEKYNPDGADATFEIIQINGGGNNQSEPGIEANLDIQYALGISYPTPNIFYSVGGSPPSIPDDNTPPDSNEPYLDWLDYILEQKKIPQVITTSYGDIEQTVPRDYAIRVCNEFAKLGAMGITVLFSSGDYGVGNGTCRTNDGSDKLLFQPNFPASCPWITSVGATTNISPETAAKLSAGGFSNYFKRPSYQKTAVGHYLDLLGDKYEGLYNRSGRGFPDISAQGEYFQVIVDQKVESVWGTSASCPTAAAVIALVNDYRLSIGKSPLGFLNPALYKHPKILTDIISGNNPGCGTDGFFARAGWDPVTGLGTPNFKQLQSLP